MMGWINSVGISHHTMRLLIVKSGRMSYDDQLHVELRISSGICGNRKWNCKSIWQ
jgi:hypothetical protein